MIRLFKPMLLVAGLIVLVMAKDTEISRDQIPEKYKWNLKDLYESNAEWEAKKDELAGRIDGFNKYKGQLGTSADMLFECLEFYSDMYKEYYRLSVYVGRLADEDTRVQEPQGMVQSLRQVGTRLSAATSFLDPELLTIEKKTIDKFMKENPWKKHRRSKPNVSLDASK